MLSRVESDIRFIVVITNSWKNFSYFVINYSKLYPLYEPINVSANLLERVFFFFDQLNILWLC